jgi:hypothetical protein
MIIRELITRLGFEADERAVAGYERQIEGLRNTMLGLVATAGAVAGALAGLAYSAAQAGDEVAKTARQLGVGGRELQQYRFAMGQLGVDTGTATASLERLSRVVGQARAGNAGARDSFARLGVRIDHADGRARSMAEILPDLSTAFAGIQDEATRAALSQEIFGRSGGRMASALAAGGEEITRLMQRFDALGGGISDEALPAAEAFTDALDDLKTIAGGLRFMIGEMLMPAMVEAANSVIDWYIANREIVRQNLADVVNALVAALRGLWSVIGTVLGAVDRVAQAMGGWGNVIRLVVSAVGALVALRLAGFLMALVKAATSAGGALALLWLAMKRIPFVALIAGLALVIDDLWAWVAGMDSITGRVLGTWEAFRDRWSVAVDQITEAAGRLFRGVVTFLSGIVKYVTAMFFGDMGRVLDGIAEAWEGAFDAIASLFSGFGAAITAVWDTIIAPILDAMGALDGITAAWQALQSSLDGILSAIAGAFRRAMEAIQPVIEALRWVIGNGAAAINAITTPPGTGPVTTPAGRFTPTTGTRAADSAMRPSGPTNFTPRAGGRENGGAINAGRSYLVGERGPEMVFPSRSGYVATARALEGMLASLGQITGLSGMIGPGQMAPAMAGMAQNFTANVTMQLPPGTPESQVQYLREQAEPMFRRMLQSEFRRAAIAFPRSE